MAASERERAVGHLAVGFALVLISAGTILQGSGDWVGHFDRVIFLHSVWICGLIICARGWLLLREVKAHSPVQWLNFLEQDAVVLMLVPVLLTVCSLIPDKSLKAMTKMLHDIELMMRFARGGL
jgi:hypothetical protein